MVDSSKFTTPTDRNQAGYAGYGNVITDADRAAWREIHAARAQEAFQRGEQALAQNDLPAAQFWLERAGRMARASPNITWALALVDMRMGRFEEAGLKMGALREKYRLREAAFLEIECLVQANEWDAALKRLREALATFNIMADMHGLPQRVVQYFGKAGWCCASNNGSIHIEAAGRVKIYLDGQDIGSGRSGCFWLPEGWARARNISVKKNGCHLLGSPVQVDALTRIEALVTADRSGLFGWAWYPSDPDYIPRLRLNNGSVFEATEIAQSIASDVPLARPRSFRIPKAELRSAQGDLAEVTDDHGRIVTGAPIRLDIGDLLAGEVDDLAEDLRPKRIANEVTPAVHEPETGGCSIVIPVYRDRDVTLQCIASVLKTVPSDTRIIVVDDATPESDLATALDGLAVSRRIELVRFEKNQGFPVAVNAGLRVAGDGDVILLNSDVIVPQGWVERVLRRLRVAGVGTVTPFSNDASIFSYPSVKEHNPVPSRQEAALLDRLCSKLFGGANTEIDIPTANGFCMAISAACLRQTGFLREDVFAQGYGEENDFCLRASALGFKHRIAPDVYVLHKGSVSFGAGKRWLMARNLDILNALHPGYDAYVADFIEHDPLRVFRQSLDKALLAKSPHKSGGVLLVVHAGGGGVERVVRERAARYEQNGEPAYVLRPLEKGCQITRPAAETDEQKFNPQNLIYDLPESEDAFISALSELNIRLIEWHQLIGHAPLIRRLHKVLRIPYDVFVHDHVWFCPRVSLLDGHGRYCGEPDVAGCETCVERWGDVLNEGLSVKQRVERSKEELWGRGGGSRLRKILRGVFGAIFLVMNSLSRPWKTKHCYVHVPSKELTYNEDEYYGYASLEVLGSGRALKSCSIWHAIYACITYPLK
ncbi:glycosyltransferase [Neokomagataea tanensis]|uniref:glycosyltransferase n=1 Tax=Neokomagataea tanensis TaxID=661191 RepID=UPI001F117290|nr:glycosyltransferase [Neokomagataea tanensis]